MTKTKSIIGLSFCPIKTTAADAEKQMSRLTLKTLITMSKTANQRADVKNPNNPAYKAAIGNRLFQLNKQAAIKKAAASQIESTEKM